MIRVVVAEAQHLVRGAVLALLRGEPDLWVVGETGNGNEVVALVRDHGADVAVLDVDMPGVGAVDVTRILAGQYPRCRTILLAAGGRPETLVRAITAGASGFLGKDAPAAQLSAAIRAVHRGEKCLDSALAAEALLGSTSPLTRRETDALRIAATGANVAQIARQLTLSSGTVRNYLSTAMSKLGARNRVDAVRICTQHGWWQ